ncbi:MAG: ATP-dependent helicase HrpB [Planctomycetota bacterium]
MAARDARPTPLPVDEALPELLDALRGPGAAVLIAPPGAGKTTRVPPAILDAGLAGDGRIVMLQPRRVAARASARRIADERGTRMGGEVGYRVRFDDRTSAETRIEVLTEGLLTRRLQADPFLEGVSVVILDEFHERSLHADLAVALLREIRADARPDLKIVVMSATLDPGPVSAFLGDCPVVRSEGRTFPVSVEHDPRPDERWLEVRAAIAARAAAARDAEGDVLVFLPGVGEIERTRRVLLEDEGVTVPVLPLHGRLRAEAQDAALAADPSPKIVLATNIAETSVTLPRVRTVVDAGLAREPRYDAAVGLERLETVRISRASADQRTGRAGRTGPGRCRRLWTAAVESSLADADRPEVRRVDLARAILEIRAWGAEPATFGWFEAPPASHVERAERLLVRLGALDAGGLTGVGRALLALPVHPRLARVVLEGCRRGCLDEATAVAALASERDIFREPPDHSDRSDLTIRLDALRHSEAGGRDGRLDRGAVRAVTRVRDQLRKMARRLPEDAARAGGRVGPCDEQALTRLLLCGFPDRVARRRGAGESRFRLAGGGGARLDPRSVVRDADLILAVSMEAGRRGQHAEHVVRVASAIQRDWLETTTATETRFDEAEQAVRQRQVTRFLDLVLDERPAGADADPAQVAAALAEAAAPRPERAFRIDDDTRALLSRLRALAAWMPELGLPTFRELDTPQDAPTDLVHMLCAGRRSFAELQRAPVRDALSGLLTHDHKAALARHAPSRMRLSNGVEARLSYDADGPPVLAARVQQLFGVRETPTVAGGRVKVVVHLLAPNGRPTQITQDLESFWRDSYQLVRKDLRGRYPKHDWPEDPTHAKPSRPGRRRNGR